MVVMLGRGELCPVLGRRKTLGNLALFLLSNDTHPLPFTQFPVAAERNHVAMLASVTHYDSEMPASLNQGLSRLLHEVRMSTVYSS